MIICSKCGAANGLGKVECRMCANPLVEPDVANSDGRGLDSFQTTVVFKNLATQQGTLALMECLICPECQTINHPGWLFCPQCGKKVDSSFVQTMELADQAPTGPVTGFPDQAPTQNPLQTVVQQMRSTDAPVAENREEAPAISQQPVHRPAEPQAQQQWMSMPEELKQRLLAQASDSANSAYRADKEPNTSAPAIEQKNTLCSECGVENSPDYFFCLSCGASLPVNKTVVMASARNRVKPLLRLLPKDGTSGPTYEIKKEARIGRTEGSITFPHDAFMSISHARVVKRGADFMLIDETGSNGTFIRVKSETRLEPGDVILVGGQLFRFEA